MINVFFQWAKIEGLSRPSRKWWAKMMGVKLILNKHGANGPILCNKGAPQLEVYQPNPNQIHVFIWYIIYPFIHMHIYIYSDMIKTLYIYIYYTHNICTIDYGEHLWRNNYQYHQIIYRIGDIFIPHPAMETTSSLRIWEARTDSEPPVPGWSDIFFLGYLGGG